MFNKKPLDSADPIAPEVQPEAVQPLPTITENKAEFDALMKNIPSVEVTLRDEKVIRNTEVPSPYSRTSTITPKTNIKRFSSFVVIDVETTGLKAEENDIIEISAIKFNEFEPAAVFSTMLKPSSPIPRSATSVNGITNTMVKNCPDFSQIKAVKQNFDYFN